MMLEIVWQDLKPDLSDTIPVLIFIYVTAPAEAIFSRTAYFRHGQILAHYIGTPS